MLYIIYYYLIEFITFENDKYPVFQSKGNASQFAIPFAKHYCIGEGYDIGFCKEEWKLPGATGIDISLDDGYSANNLPKNKLMDYIYSSHCLEHVDNWVETLELWISVLKPRGVLFLYLPDFSQRYWRPWNNRKHKQCFTPSIIREFLEDKGMRNVTCSGIDLNNSFMIVLRKIIFSLLCLHICIPRISILGYPCYLFKYLKSFSYRVYNSL